MQTVGECQALAKPREEAGVAAPMAFYFASSLCSWITLHFHSSLYSLNCGQEVVWVEAAGGALGTSAFLQSCSPEPLAIDARGCQAWGGRAAVDARGARPGEAEPAPVPFMLLTVINSLGWGLRGGPYGCLLISFKWNTVQPWRGKKWKTLTNGSSAREKQHLSRLRKYS